MSAAETGNLSGFSGTGSGPELPPGVDPKGSQLAQDIRSAAINAGAGQRVNPGFFDSRTRLSPNERLLAKTYREDPNNRFAKQAYKNTGQGGLLNMLRSGGVFGNLVRGAGQKFGWGKKYNEPTYDMSAGNQLGLYKPSINPDYYYDTENEDVLNSVGAVDSIAPIAINNNLNTTGIDETGAEYLEGKGINTEFLKHGGRAGYRGGQLVGPSGDGSRPGYSGLPNIFMTPGGGGQRKPPGKLDFMTTTGPLTDAQKDILNNLSDEEIKMLEDEGNLFDFIENIIKTPFIIRGGDTEYRASGGRAGYAFGEEVEQETDFIQGPQGGEEFQETVVQGQEQPSREQLEALAMEIFQLPLDDLDEQQLLVVYQEAMQGQPMEEAVQEDEVQFAAQGGLAGLL